MISSAALRRRVLELERHYAPPPSFMVSRLLLPEGFISAEAWPAYREDLLESGVPAAHLPLTVEEAESPTDPTGKVVMPAPWPEWALCEMVDYLRSKNAMPGEHGRLPPREPIGPEECRP